MERVYLGLLEGSFHLCFGGGPGTEATKDLAKARIGFNWHQWSICGQTVITIARSEPWFLTPVESSLLNQRQIVNA